MFDLTMTTGGYIENCEDNFKMKTKVDALFSKKEQLWALPQFYASSRQYHCLTPPRSSLASSPRRKIMCGLYIPILLFKVFSQGKIFLLLCVCVHNLHRFFLKEYKRFIHFSQKTGPQTWVIQFLQLLLNISGSPATKTKWLQLYTQKDVSW